jgi:hypothetical protein
LPASLTLQPQNEGICRVLTDSGLHVGNLKQISGSWKFKAIGYDASGQLIPGGGPLTDRHNAVFETLDQVKINQVLG